MHRRPIRPKRCWENTHYKTYRHPTYLTWRGLIATALLGALIPAALLAINAPYIIGSVLVGVALMLFGVASDGPT